MDPFFLLLLGTIIGLSQVRIKRLLTYSTISHVGFILLALGINTQLSIEAFLFYLIQYSITNVNVFLVLLAFGYCISNTDIQYIDELKAQFKTNPILCLSFTICLFSIAGIPPLVGFFGKLIVINSAMHSGYYFLTFIGILVSVISTSYYLKIIERMYFSNQSLISNNNKIGTIHSTIIAILTLFQVLYVMAPSILLNSCNLLSLTLFSTLYEYYYYIYYIRSYSSYYPTYC